jgi:N-acetylglucosamine-6-phosphate deacetylase
MGPDGYGIHEVDWSSGSPSFAQSSGRADVILVPGFVDIHLHGAHGIDFISASHDDLIKLCNHLAADGYEAFLPTTVTAPKESILAALAALPEHPMIPGFHLEGPFLSRKHPGAQPAEYIQPLPSDGSWDEVLLHPQLRVITLAPELEGAQDWIRRLSQRGVIVSMGHSDATYAEADQAEKAGARHVTHTFNAMRGFHHREAGLAGYAMLSGAISTELIYDRLHVCPEAASLLIDNKRLEKLIAVSDSTMAARMAPNQTVNMWGHECVTAPGEVRLCSNGALAGSAITLLDAFRNLREDFGGEVATCACSLNPRKAIGLTSSPSVYVELDRELQIANIRRVHSS